MTSEEEILAREAVVVLTLGEWCLLAGTMKGLAAAPGYAAAEEATAVSEKIALQIREQPL